MKPNYRVRYDGGPWQNRFCNHSTGQCFYVEDEKELGPKALRLSEYQSSLNWSCEPLAQKQEGGPATYYDFEEGWVTWNDLADFKSTNQWKEHSFHLGNVGKAIYRWGSKGGTSKSYDTRKIIYSGLRVLMMLEGKAKTVDYLNELLNDNQFKDK